MSFLARATQRTLSAPDIQTAAERIWARSGGNNQAWRRKSVAQALGVPAILSAVSLISGTVGRLSLDAYQNGSQVLDRAKVPQLMIRPNPKSTPREFFLLTAFYQATRGEFWWYVAHRDGDGNADALYPVPPWEVTVQANPSDRSRPIITWAGKVRRNEDMRHQIYLPDPKDPAGVRGVGPLQLAGAAVSIASEADTWAGNFFSGSLPSLVGTTKLDLDEIDLKALDDQWKEKANNLPRWMGSDMHLEPPPYDAQKAQLTETRDHQVGEVARMFDMPGSLLEYQMSGQSLTYRNNSDIWTDFQQRCLSPHYLEPIEQEMSDLVVRSITTRFSTWELTKADILTRYQVYETGITKSGVLSVEAAQRMEGLAPGDVNYAPVPVSPPSAVTAIPSQLSRGPVRCLKCNWLLAEAADGYFKATCRKCKTVTELTSLQEREDPMVTMMALLASREPPQPPAPAPVNVTIESGAIAAPDMSGMVEAITALANREQPQPAQTTFAEGAFHSEVHVPDSLMLNPPPVEPPVVNVLPDPTFVEAMKDLREIMLTPRKRNVIRNNEGRIIGVEDVV